MKKCEQQIDSIDGLGFPIYPKCGCKAKYKIKFEEDELFVCKKHLNSNKKKS